MAYTSLPNGLLINAQANLNPKVQFATVTELADLGTANVLAYTYYDSMLVYCVKDKDWYIWREKQVYDSSELVVGNFTYPASYVSFGFDYSSKIYNFYKVHNAKTITPYGEIDIRKVSTSLNEDAIEAGDYVVNTILANDDFLIFGVYVSGDPFVEASYAPASINILKF